jgi:Chaperone of endosialidase
MKKPNTILVLSALVGLALLPIAQAGPAPEAPQPNPPAPGALNTRDGQNAMPFVTTGFANSAFGAFSLFSNTDGAFNTGVGAGALDLNVGDQSTGDGVNNTAVGAAALLFNTTGSNNAAVGTSALLNNTEGGSNTAVGSHALTVNQLGGGHTAVGANALENNTASGFLSSNTAVGISAAITSTTGGANVAVGEGALLSVDTGSANTCIGALAGASYNADETSNICIGAGTGGSSGENNTIRIGDTLASNGIVISDGTILGAQAFTIASGLVGGGIQFLEIIGFSSISIEPTLSQTTGASSCFVGGIFNQTPTGGSHDVEVGPDNKLADATLSSRRFKKDIAPIDKLSEGILALRPVTFHWKNDNTNEPEFGLVAEEVAEVNLDWITRNPQGEISGVRYKTIPILLLNEFLKEHKKVEEQQANIAELKSTVGVLTAQLKEQAAQIQKVSAQLEMVKPAPKVVGNKP